MLLAGLDVGIDLAPFASVRNDGVPFVPCMSPTFSIRPRFVPSSPGRYDAQFGTSEVVTTSQSESRLPLHPM